MGFGLSNQTPQFNFNPKPFQSSHYGQPFGLGLQNQGVQSGSNSAQHGADENTHMSMTANSAPNEHAGMT